MIKKIKRCVCGAVLLTGLGIGSSIGTLPAQTLTQALDTARSDLKAAMTKLEKTQQEIAAEKPEISKKFGEKEQHLAKLRRQMRIARKSIADRKQELQQLQRDVAVRKQDAGYLSGLLKDHALKIQTLTYPGQPELSISSDIILDKTGKSATGLEKRLQIIDASLDRLEGLLGGSLSSGKAVSEDGKALQGSFAAAGPLSWFEGEGVAGEIQMIRGEPLPKVRKNGGSLGGLMQGQEATVGVDVTGGMARALDEAGGGFIELVKKGGLWVWPILIMALISLLLGIWKTLEFAKYRQPGEAWVNAILAALRTGDKAKAEQLAAQPKHPAAEVMGHLVEQSGATADVVEESLYERLMSVQDKASALLPVIAITAATAPLFGLLGTVSGMIQTFNLITVFGSGDPKPLAGGISEALITTLFGLVVAIPALILHAFLSRRSHGIVQTTERLGLAFVNAQRTK